MANHIKYPSKILFELDDDKQVTVWFDHTPAEEQYFNPVMGVGHPGCDQQIIITEVVVDGKSYNPDQVAGFNGERAVNAIIEMLDACDQAEEECYHG